METRAHHVLIGLFTVLVVVGGMLFGLWLAKSSMDNTFKDYEVVFNEAVSGLSKGSSVQYNGIKVGDVIELRLDDKDPRRVLALIRLAANTPVKVDTKAKLALTGVTGTSIIQLSGGDPNSPPLKGKDGKLPVIVASPSPIARLLTDGTDVISNVNMLLHNANKLFSPENVDSFGKTLSNLEQTTSAISSQRGDIAQTLKQLSLVGKQATAALEQTTTLMRNANGILNTKGQQMFSDAGQAMKSLEQSTQTINTLINNNEDSLNNGMQGLNQLGPAVNELRETLSTLRAISRRLEANPSGFLLNREQTKEFTP
ncbi:MULTISPECIES: MlaD family protein [Pseudomonas]|uniref:MCE family protein n=1 Tax=Pseudomonas saxonica TaxID=2600598 RepID=A0A5C5PSC2_9PSED|nr:MULTISPECIES: MlaD family protein [Pseudomonas]MCH4872451.1 MCE family protein [Pseudomonas sp. TMW22091]TWR81678.1 MCE family protein [Pseudomonas saxonica]TWR89052.1 MCE family protein [Pseudomonas saxonica]WRQ77145.1 MlaD family protein [Pseudomonas saxonica]